jgi:hypothetical protein
MKEKQKVHFIEVIIVLAIIGMIASIILRITKPEPVTQFFNDWHTNYPILSNLIYFCVFSTFSVWTLSGIISPDEEDDKGFGDYYRLLLFGGAAIYFLIKLINNITT